MARSVNTKLLLSLRNLSLNNTYLPGKATNYFAMPFYAVARGRTAGIYMTWADCEAQVKGFSGARYKKFDSVTSAQEFITSEGSGGIKSQSTWKNVNDAGTYSTSNNLKRSYSTSAAYNQKKSTPATASSTSKVNKKNPRARKSQVESEDESAFSDNSDDLNTILVKQMDDIEKRLNGFEKGVDKIIKKSTKVSNKQTILIDPPQPKKRKANNKNEFDENEMGFVRVYTDGACSSNGRAGARAGLGVYWGDGHHLNISAPVSGRATNNCGEIQAATQAIRTALDNGINKLEINTDSKFLINSVTKWIPGWKRKGWKLQSGEPVKNEIDFKELDELQHQLQVKWNYVEAHKGVHGNEMADQLAKAGAAKYGYKH